MSPTTARAPDPAQLNQRAIDTVRFLAVDAIQKANSGHPGLPLGAAPMTGYNLPLEQIKQFLQWSSITPAHPERDITPGVEVTNSPLGQAFGNGAGMAIAEAYLAASLAGHLKLGKLVYLYDDNRITLSASMQLTSREDHAQRFAAYGWNTQSVEDGTDLKAIERAIRAARQDTERPSLILVWTNRLSVDCGREVEAEWKANCAACEKQFPEDAHELRQLIKGELPPDRDATVPQFPFDPKGMATRVASGKGGSADLNPSTALVEVPVIYVFTYDSIAMGEDGPTHQSVGHVATLANARPQEVCFRRKPSSRSAHSGGRPGRRTPRSISGISRLGVTGTRIARDETCLISRQSHQVRPDASASPPSGQSPRSRNQAMTGSRTRRTNYEQRDTRQPPDLQSATHGGPGVRLPGGVSFGYALVLESRR